jgi:hypothetical protein
MTCTASYTIQSSCTSIAVLLEHKLEWLTERTKDRPSCVRGICIASSRVPFSCTSIVVSREHKPEWRTRRTKDRPSGLGLNSANSERGAGAMPKGRELHSQIRQIYEIVHGCRNHQSALVHKCGSSPILRSSHKQPTPNPPPLCHTTSSRHRHRHINHALHLFLFSLFQAISKTHSRPVDISDSYTTSQVPARRYNAVLHEVFRLFDGAVLSSSGYVLSLSCNLAIKSRTS